MPQHSPASCMLVVTPTNTTKSGCCSAACASHPSCAVCRRLEAAQSFSRSAETLQFCIQTIASMATDQLAALMGPGGITTLIENMMSPEDTPRKQAEELFGQLKQQADTCCGLLLNVLRTSPQVDHRQFAAIIMRKTLTRDDPTLWSKCSPAMQSTIKNELLAAMREEQQRTVVKKICDTVSELAVELVDDKAPGGTYWPELLPTMFQCVQSGLPALMESGLTVLGTVATYMIDVMKPQLPALVNGLNACLAHNNADVQLAALTASAQFIQATEEPAEREKFAPLLQPMLACLGATLNMGAEASAQEALATFIEVAEAHPRFLRRNLTDVVGAMLTIARAEQLESGTRSLAAEFLVTLCEAREKAPGMMRKLPNFSANLFETLMLFLLDVEDDQLWHQAESEEHEDEGAGDLFSFSQECLDRVAISLGGNALVPVAGALLPQWLTDTDWRKRHASLICLAQIAEGCQKVMQSQIDPLVDMCVKGLQDPVPKVRWAACQALGQMCTDLGPNIQDACHAKILPALMSVMDDFNNPRVQAHASAAVVNFSEGADQDLLPPYLDVLITKLLVLLQHGKKLVQEGALTAMASVADCSNQLFVKYYDTVMPLLLSILSGANDKAHRLLRGKALECVSLVGMAVGRDRFREDAARVLQWLQALQSAELEADDPTLGYMLQAGARLCKCLRDEFVPYLPIVMPPLLKSAVVEPDIKISELEEDIEEEDDGDVEHIRMGDKLVSIRTSSLEEKSTACNMLCCYADELKEGFFPYVKPVADIMVPLLKFWFHEDVRRAAVQTLPELLRSAVMCRDKGLHGVDNNLVQQLLGYMWPAMIEALGKEPDADVQSAHLDSIAEVVELVDPGMLSSEQVETTFMQFGRIFKDAEKRRAEREQRRHTEDFDEEELEALEEENQVEEELCDQVGTAIGAFLKKFGDAVLPYVEALMPQIGALLDKARPSEDRRIAICIVDDLLQHSAAGRAKYFGTVLPILLEASTSNHEDLRQCAVYGLGVLAAKAPEQFRPVVPQTLQIVQTIIQQPDSRNDDNEMATENAIATLGKLLEFHSEVLDGNAVASAWLNALPLTADAVEAQEQHELLARYLTQRDVRILGPGNANIPKLVHIAVVVLGHGTRLVTGEVGLRLAQLLAGLNPPADLVQAELAKLKERQRGNFNTYMSGSAPPASDD